MRARRVIPTVFETLRLWCSLRHMAHKAQLCVNLWDLAVGLLQRWQIRDHRSTWTQRTRNMRTPDQAFTFPVIAVPYATSVLQSFRKAHDLRYCLEMYQDKGTTSCHCNEDSVRDVLVPLIACKISETGALVSRSRCGAWEYKHPPSPI